MIKRPHFWIAAASAVGVLVLAIVDMERTSPGELTAVHAGDEDLSGGNNCSACHGGWFGGMTESCMECHEDIGQQVEGAFGLHGILGAAKAERCAVCHSEHHGPGFAIVNLQSFLEAGAGRPEEFDHATIGFPMDGKHLELECSKCHENADVAVLPAGEQRFLGLDQDCAACHEDPHEGRMAISCVKCHGQEDFHLLASRGHEDFLPLIGGHGDVDCRKCHELGEVHSLENLARARGERPEPRECMDCHESPHEESFLRGVARLERRTPPESCVECHLPEHTSFRASDVETTPDQHALSGFSLDFPHDSAECADCHDPLARRFEIRYPGRLADDCVQCHRDVHEGQFDDGPFGKDGGRAEPKGCLECHERTWFEPHLFTVEKHAGTALPLVGTHAETECNECHEPKRRDGPRVFRGTSDECESCHVDAHVGFFDTHASSGFSEPVEHGECARCHVATHFDEIPKGAFDHELWTGFAVRGAHAQTECESCHPRAETPDEWGRRFGRVEEHFGPIDPYGSGCETCHEDPHAGRFDDLLLPMRVGERTGCARCHVETSFRAFPDGFDHLKWTDYPLLDAHGEAACSDCHPPLSRPDENGRTWSPVLGTSCDACHESPHLGQFEVAGRTDCRRCHSSAASFSELVFDHERHSRFPLGEAHRNVDCGQCHEPQDVGGRPVVRYRPLDRECVDCHGLQEDELIPRKRLLRKKG